MTKQKADVEIEILAFAGCPNVAAARHNVEEAMREEGRAAHIVEVEVDTPELATAHRFLGSPSIRINGRDVEPGAEDRADYGLMCRTYRRAQTTVGAPPVEMIREASRGDRITEPS